MRWPQDAQDWPMRDHSRFVHHRPHHWHVQEDGTGPTLLLIHGAGGATQSWRGLFPLLARDHHVVAVDLPGQGFTRMGARGRCGLEPVSEDLLALCRSEGWQPRAMIGHSAGAAVALRMAELGAPGDVIGINAALGEFEGLAGILYPVMARVLALTPLTAMVFTATATDRTVRNLLRNTGSTLDEEGIALYRRLATDRTHVDATLAMMAQWDLSGLLSRLPQFDRPVHLITGSQDRAVPPQISRDVAARMPRATLTDMPGLGHLAHEEAAGEVAQIVRDTLAAA